MSEVSEFYSRLFNISLHNRIIYFTFENEIEIKLAMLIALTDEKTLHSVIQSLLADTPYSQPQISQDITAKLMSHQSAIYSTLNMIVPKEFMEETSQKLNKMVHIINKVTQDIDSLTILKEISELSDKKMSPLEIYLHSMRELMLHDMQYNIQHAYLNNPLAKDQFNTILEHSLHSYIVVEGVTTTVLKKD